MKNLQKDERGIAHLVLVMLVAVVVAAVGFVGWQVMNKDKSTGGTAADQAARKIAEVACNKDMDDKDLCKFFTSWKANTQYRLVSTDTSDGKTTKSTFEVDGDNSRISIADQGYEVITIGKTTYTKAGDTWWKQTITEPDQDVADDYKQSFEEPSDDSKSSEGNTTYKALGKEVCGDLTCFKYQVVDPDSSGKQFLWFDDKDYQLRKSRTETSDGVSEQIYEYGNISVSEPSPVKELGPNQYIIPGQPEPLTLPSAQ